ncbi:MAG: pectate lyase [Pirellulaceae bacterium]|nr:pectate lyase [Pirellulaceae bacterium]
MQRFTWLLLVWLCLGYQANMLLAQEKRLEPIDLSPFYSCIHHWRDLRDESRFIQVQKNQPAYAATQVREIVDNILLFQRDNGGWPKDYDMTAVLTDDQRAEVIATRSREDTSYDNGNIHSQVGYLAKATSQLDDPKWRTACERGFDFIIRSQYPNGGIPQRYPNAQSFHKHITFNDGVMMGVMELLSDAANGAEYFAWLDQPRKQQARLAVQRGIACILKCQIRVGDQLTAWCQQHDEITYEPRPARTFELASICPQESTEILRYLMHQPSPSPEIIQAVDAAVAWLDQVKLLNTRIDRVKAKPESFLRHDTDLDVVAVHDPMAKPTWARHYEIGSNRPIFAGRDGIKRYALAEIERERRTGTAWYGGWATDLITKEYASWKAAIKAGPNRP